MEKIDKPWGHEEIIIQNDKYVVKKLFIKAKHRLSLQMHERKHETLFALEGNPSITLKEQFISLTIGGYVDIPNLTIHRIAASGNMDALLLEVSTPELNDVIRYEDDYGRVAI